MTINKKEFVDRMAEIGGITKKEANRGVDAFIETLIDCMNAECVVKFVGFGRFELKTAKEKPARNPRTGESCIVPEHKKVKFYASEGLSERMKELGDEN